MEMDCTAAYTNPDKPKQRAPIEEIVCKEAKKVCGMLNTAKHNENGLKNKTRNK